MVGNNLTLAVGPVATGTYKTDGQGWYQFAAADAGDTVRINYVVDFYYTVPKLRDLRGNILEADFYKSWGVRNAQGKPLQRVALQVPLILGTDQYAVDANGVFYFDYTNAGETFYFDTEFETDGGSRFEVNQEDIGSAPLVRIALSNNDIGQEMLLTFEQAMCEGMGIKTKADDAGDAFKFVFKCAIDRVSRRSHAINMSS